MDKEYAAADDSSMSESDIKADPKIFWFERLNKINVPGAGVVCDDWPHL
jgi:hypothetical protein